MILKIRSKKENRRIKTINLLYEFDFTQTQPTINLGCGPTLSRLHKQRSPDDSALQGPHEHNAGKIRVFDNDAAAALRDVFPPEFPAGQGDDLHRP